MDANEREMKDALQNAASMRHQKVSIDCWRRVAFASEIRVYSRSWLMSLRSVRSFFCVDTAKGSESRFPGMDYIVCPGNAGEPDALVIIRRILELQ